MKFRINEDRTKIELLNKDGSVIKTWDGPTHEAAVNHAPQHAIDDMRQALNDAPWWLTKEIVSGFD